MDNNFETNRIINCRGTNWIKLLDERIILLPHGLEILLNDIKYEVKKRIYTRFAFSDFIYLCFLPYLAWWNSFLKSGGMFDGLENYAIVWVILFIYPLSRLIPRNCVYFHSDERLLRFYPQSGQAHIDLLNYFKLRNISPLLESFTRQDSNNINLSTHTLLGTPLIQQDDAIIKNEVKKNSIIKINKVFNSVVAINYPFNQIIKRLSQFFEKYSENYHAFRSLRIKVRNNNDREKDLLVLLPRYGRGTKWFSINVICTKNDNNMLHINFQPILFRMSDKIIIIFGMMVCIFVPILWLIFVPSLIFGISMGIIMKNHTKNYLNNYIIPNFIKETDGEIINIEPADIEDESLVSRISKNNFKSLLKVSFMMVLISTLLFWIPILGPFIGGFIGGRRTTSILNAIKAAVLPSLILSIFITVFIGYFSQYPILGILAGVGTAIFILGNIVPLILGAIIGGANPKQ